MNILNMNGEIVSQDFDNYTEAAADMAADNNIFLDFYRDSQGFMRVDAISNAKKEDWVFCSLADDDSDAIEEMSKEIVDVYLTESYFMEK